MTSALTRGLQTAEQPFTVPSIVRVIEGGGDEIRMPQSAVEARLKAADAKDTFLVGAGALPYAVHDGVPLVRAVKGCGQQPAIVTGKLIPLGTATPPADDRVEDAQPVLEMPEVTARKAYAETRRSTLPFLMHEVHTFIRTGVPSLTALTGWMFGLKRRLDRPLTWRT